MRKERPAYVEVADAIITRKDTTPMAALHDLNSSRRTLLEVCRHINALAVVHIPSFGSWGGKGAGDEEEGGGDGSEAHID